MIDEAHLALALRLQQAHEVGIGHGCEGVVGHPALAQELIAHKEVALKDRAAIVWKGRRGDGEVGAKGLHQGLCHRPNVARRGAIEGGAVLEIDLLGARGKQPGQGLTRLHHRLLRGNGA
jgi:hypothetical protein